MHSYTLSVHTMCSRFQSNRYSNTSTYWKLRPSSLVGVPDATCLLTACKELEETQAYIEIGD